MTVLWESGECPPKKRLCLSTNQLRRFPATNSLEVHERSASSISNSQSMAMPIEAGKYLKLWLL